MSKKLFNLLTCFSLFFIASTTAQVAMNGAGSYSQNFDGLPNSGTGLNWADNSSIANWYAKRTGTGTSIAVDNGSGTGGNLYSYGTTGVNERAIGSLGSGNAAAGNFAWGAQFQNTGASNLSNFVVTYTLEQWRKGGTTSGAHSVTFWYKVGSTNTTDLQPNNNGSWTQVTALTSTSLQNNQTAGLLDGNLAANSQLVTAVIPGLTILAGEYLLIKWDDPDHPSSDHGLAVDNFSMSWTISCATYSSLTTSACSPYTAPSGATRTTTGIFNDTINNAASCDSIITINLTILPNTTSTITDVACGSYTAPSGAVFTSTGTYLDTIPNANGCDSIITLNLTFTGSITFYQDSDNDGFGNPLVTQVGCAPPIGYVTNSNDCNDANALITIGTIYYQDYDNDGFGNSSVSILSCNAIAGYVINSNDCNDTNALIGTAPTWYLDNDNDGFGGSVDSVSCTQPVGYVLLTGDCNDNNSNIHPNATEIPDNGIDEDCSGADLSTQIGLYEFTGHDNTTTFNMNVTSQPTNGVFSSYVKSDSLNFSSGLGFLNTTSWSTDTFVNLNHYVGFTFVPNACYAADLTKLTWLHRASNTLGLATVHLRSSLDNFTTDIASITFPALATAYTETVLLPAQFSNLTNAIEFRWYLSNVQAITGAYRHDNVTLFGSINALPTSIYYADVDGDGFGNPMSDTTYCQALPGFVADNTDCDDNNADAFPGAIWYLDNDGDGFGSNTSQVSCLQPLNYVSNNDDCDDNNLNITGITYYQDLDLDGIGSSVSTVACSQPVGYVTNTGDCDDNDDQVGLPSNQYFLDADADGFGGSIDTIACSLPLGYVTNSDDCDDSDDQIGNATTEYYLDSDGDGFGAGVGLVVCTPAANYVENNDDCNDANDQIYPGATEIPNNGIDEDCSGSDSIVGIDDYTSSLVSLFPNPSVNEFTVKANTPILEYTIISNEGRVLISMKDTFENNEIIVSVEHLTPGVYRVIVKTEEIDIPISFIKK